MPEITIMGIGDTKASQESMARRIKDDFNVDAKVVEPEPEHEPEPPTPEPATEKQDHRLTPEERVERVAAAFKAIEEAVADITTGEDWQHYLDAQSKFHQYSARNVLWLQAQAAHREMELDTVASYRAWQKMGRQVERGSVGFKVLAPITYEHKKDEIEIEADRRNAGAHKLIGGATANPDAPTERRIRGFKVETVFDVSQTSGEPLPEPPALHRLVGECPQEIIGAIEQEITIRGYQPTTVKPALGWPDSANGRTLPGTHEVQIRDDLSPAQRAKTLAHELTHIVMEHTDSNPKSETEAESVAYIVMRHLGVDSGDYSFGYVSSWAKSPEIVQRSAEAIRKTATTLVERLDARIENTVERDIPDAHLEAAYEERFEGPELEIAF
jgi:hypothetical protein